MVTVYACSILACTYDKMSPAAPSGTRGRPWTRGIGRDRTERKEDGKEKRTRLIFGVVTWSPNNAKGKGIS